MQYLHTIDWSMVGGFAAGIAILLFMLRMMDWDTENDPELNREEIADNAVTDRKIVGRIKDGVIYSDPNLQCGELNLTPGHVEPLYLINEDYRHLFGAPPARTPEDLWKEWCRDKWDFDMDLDRFARKWRGRVPKKPPSSWTDGIDITDWKWCKEIVLATGDEAKKLDEYMRAHRTAEEPDIELLGELTKLRMQALASGYRTRGFMYRGVDITDLLYEMTTASELARKCIARAWARAA